MRDVEKTSIPHETNSRRSRRRKRGRSLYVVMIIVLALSVIVALCMTLFFNIKTIRVTGNAENYHAEDIVTATGIELGDNMIRLDTKAARERALAQLIYVEEIEIDRQFPNTLEIRVQKCTPAYNVMYDFGTLIVSEHGRILDDTMDPVDGLVKITGYQPEETTPGCQVKAKEERYDKVFNAFRDIIYEGGLTVPIVGVDMTDLADIMVDLDHRIVFDMGNWSEIDYKISFAEQVISELPADKEGYLVMIGSNQCSFRNKADYEATQKAIAAANAAEKDKGKPKATEAAEDGDGTEEETVAHPEDELPPIDEGLGDEG